MIRPLTTADFDALLHLAPKFWAEGKLPGGFDPVVFRRSWTALVDTGVGVILGMFEGEQITGALGLLLVNDINDGVRVGTEAFWFVDPSARGSGVRLLVAFEEYAKALGAKRLVMVHLSAINAPVLKKVYERRGYREIETSYFKEIS